MTNSALKSLVKTLEEYKRKGNLTEKQTRQINKTLTSLHKQIRKNNPFSVIADAVDEAHERAALYDSDIQKVTAAMQKLADTKEKNGKLTEEEAREYDKLKKRLKELLQLQKESGEVSASAIVDGINNAISTAKQATEMFTDMMDALGGENGSRAVKTIKQVTGILEKGGQGAAMGAQIGGGWGALIGGVAGTLTGVVTTFADVWSGNASITEQIDNSVLSVKKLENAYKSLEYTVEEAYGTSAAGAKRALIANKELQLAELRRQLQLEESRKEKNKDESRIEELKGQIIDLENEISNSTKEIVNDLLSISSVGDAAENLVSQMIEAFKKGEDYMGKFGDTFEGMIDNMIMKAIVGEVIGRRMEALFQQVQAMATKRADEQRVTWADLIGKSNKEWEESLDRDWEASKNKSPWGQSTYADVIKKLQDLIAKEEDANLKKVYENYLAEVNKMYAEAASITPEDVSAIRGSVDSWKEGVQSEFEMWMEAFGVKYGQDAASNQLSALQQGIQGVTETTAGAIEAYMNGVSQQVYLHSELLTQIRDAVDNISGDAMLGSVSQILLQLQTSYQTQQAIQSILEGWSNPSGQAVKVELIS